MPKAKKQEAAEAQPQIKEISIQDVYAEVKELHKLLNHISAIVVEAKKENSRRGRGLI